MRVEPSVASFASPAPPSETARAGKAFEAWFVGYVVHEMQGAMGGVLGDGAASTFSGLFEQELGKRIADGPGLGLAAQIDGALARRRGIVEGDTSLTHPMYQGPRVTSAFGARRDPIDGDTRMHHGVDLAAPTGTPVRAARDGVVRSADTRGGYGNVVVLDHGDGLESRYAHCDTLAVKPGQVVRAGDVVATVGATGRATGAHLHFELRDDGRAVDPRDEAARVLDTGLPPSPRAGLSALLERP